MTKILVFLALLIFSGVVASKDVNADNEIVLDDFTLHYYEGPNRYAVEYLLLEIDFTQGDSAVVDIDVDVVGNKDMSVFLVQRFVETYDPNSGWGPSWTLYPSYTAEGVRSYEKQFTMRPGVWYRGTYYFLIKHYRYEEICVDVDFSVLVDYDGDGLYGDRDDDPTTSDTWLKVLEDRLSGIDTSISLNYKWVVENITALSSDLDGFKSSIQAEVWGQAMDLSELRRNLLTLQNYVQDNIASLSALRVENLESLDSMNETMVSIGLKLESEITALSEALDMVDGWLQEVEAQLETDLAITNDRIDGVEDDMLGRLADAKAGLNLTLIELDGREKDNNDARMQEIQDAQTDIENAQEDIEDALEEARAARAVGLVTGLVGIILAIVAIVLMIRSRKQYGGPPTGSISGPETP